MSANLAIKSWQGKTVWVIGASAGIGQALAQDLARQGARVIASARGQARLEAAVANWPNAHAVAFDFSDAKASQNAWQTVVSIAGVPDVVVINAGIYVPMPASKFDPVGMKLQFDTNIGGPSNILGEVLPAFIAAKQGHVVLVSSVAGYRGLPLAMAYGATKAALTYMAQCLYIELAPKGIGISVVCPGFVSTDLTAGNRFAMPALQTPQQASAAVLKGLSLGQFEIHFPKRFSWFLKALQLLPFTWYAALLRKTL